MDGLKQTPLYDLHLELGAKMVPFAGWSMPVQYPMGVLKEHLHCRAAAGLFDVSHMGQVILRGEHAAAALEALVPVSVEGLQTGRQRYGYFTNENGGLEDDLMIANRGDHFLVVVNAARVDHDLALMQGMDCDVEFITDRALLALQGPGAEAAFAQLVPGVADMRFMDVTILPSDFGDLWISRSGYTGEDGFEISVDATLATDFARALLADATVAPIGLGARDSLRLEAGLCLYGHDIDAQISPIEAGLGWAIQKIRRAGGLRAGGFPGAERILGELENGAARLRVGLLPEGRAPMREGVVLFATETAADPIGLVTSGGFGPSLNAPLAMGYLPANLSTTGTTVWGEVRGKRLPARVTDLPFRPATFKR